MIDQEGGLVKRLSGAPQASAQSMGRRGADYSRRQGALTARNLKRVGVNVNLAPGAGRRSARERDPRPAPELRRQATPRDPHCDPVRERDRAPRRERHGKHFPGLGAAAESTDLAVQRIRLRRGGAAADRRAALSCLRRTGGDLVMLSTAIYTRFSRKPAAFSKRVATRELRPGWDSGRLDQRRARDGVGPPLRRAGQGGRRRGEGRHRPAPVHGSTRRRSRRAGAPPRATLGKAGARAVRGLGPARAGPAGQALLAVKRAV